jgi:hypothetical protein
LGTMSPRVLKRGGPGEQPRGEVGASTRLWMGSTIFPVFQMARARCLALSAGPPPILPTKGLVIWALLFGYISLFVTLH